MGVWPYISHHFSYTYIESINSLCHSQSYHDESHHDRSFPCIGIASRDGHRSLGMLQLLHEEGRLRMVGSGPKRKMPTTA
jgi:hypothetical protein